MLKISWIDIVTKKEVQERISAKKNVWSSIKKIKNKWMGHFMRHGTGLLKLIIKNCVGGKNCKRRSRMKHIQQIVKDQGCGFYEERKRKTSIREE